MSFDFDMLIDRHRTDSLKWSRFAGRDAIPMWVADMDFASPPAVLAALQNRVAHGVFGYPETPPELVDVVLAMLQREYQWSVQPDWLVWLPGLVSGLSIACRSLGEADDEVLTTVPIYPPFLSVPRVMQRRTVAVPLVRAAGRWQHDLDRFEAAITPRTRLFLLCSPHNPTGRIYERGELSALAEICLRHDVVICSDEIHNQLLLDRERTHLPTACLAPEVAARTITLMAPSKTYNIAGLGCSFAIIADPTLRRRFVRAAAGIVPGVNVLGYVAALAAYRDGRPWLSALLDYLRGNHEAVQKAVRAIPGLRTTPVEATYLAWFDATETGLADPAGFLSEAGVALSDGKDFGAPGFLRLNFGCRRALLAEAMSRIRTALEGRDR